MAQLELSPDADYIYNAHVEIHAYQNLLAGGHKRARESTSLQ